MPYILFSPVGGTDPISNERDGSMLHICRKYQPDHVVLYLSKEMVGRQNKDNRYRECIRRLAQSRHFSTEIESIERPELSEVQLYDFFLEEFRPMLCELHQRFPDHELILNVSSGTPAMKNALNLLAFLLPFPVIPVQVSTPVKAQNPRLEPHQEYDTDLYWEFNLDQNESTYEDRCCVVQYHNLNAQLQLETISAHLWAYDYTAALSVAGRIRPFLTDRAYELLKTAKARIELDWNAIKPEFKKELGLSGSNKGRINLSEYLLWLQMKQKRGDLADFLRGLTPALFELLRVAVEERSGYLLSQYCNRYGRLVPEWMRRDKTGADLLTVLEANGKTLDHPVFLISAHYCDVIKARCASKPWADPLLRLRDVEEGIRNITAHTITKVTEEKIRIDSKLSSREIVELLRDAVQKLNEDGSDSSKKITINWGAYDAMNQIIEQALVGN